MSGDEQWRETLAAAQALALEYLGGLRERRVAHPVLPPAPEPPDGIGFDSALALVGEHIAPWLSASPGPRYLGYVTGGALPEAVAAEWLVAAWDQNVSNGAGSIAADLEAKTVSAFADAFGLRAGMHGQFVSGATAANLVCIATAREWAKDRAGATDASVTVFAGAAHSSIGKALAITGIGRSRLQAVSTLPGRTAIDPAALAAALQAYGAAPAVVVASAGEVNTGDFDDLVALSRICREHDAWLHVDGAFGLFAAFDASRRARLDGIDHADSVTVDMHKWLNVPYDSAIAYTTRPDLQRRVFGASASYLGDDPDPLHFTPENSRRFRAFAPWMVLATRGRRGIGEIVTRNCMQAEAFARQLTMTGRFDVLGGVHLNIVCFAPAGTDASERDLFLDRLNRTGEVFMTPTQLFGRPAIRAAFSNWSTDDADVERVVRAVVDALR